MIRHEALGRNGACGAAGDVLPGKEPAERAEAAALQRCHFPFTTER